MNEENICPHCGASMKEYWHSLTLGMVESLIQFARVVKNKNSNKVHITKEAGFDVNQWCNFKKLQYFGLVAKWKDPNDDNTKTGFWVLTRNGLDFLQDKLPVPQKVKTFRGKKIENGEDLVLINEFHRRATNILYWEKEFDFDIAQGKLIL